MQRFMRTLVVIGSLTASLALMWAGAQRASAQGSPLMTQKLAETRASLAKNEQMLGQYTWAAGTHRYQSIAVAGSAQMGHSASHHAGLHRLRQADRRAGLYSVVIRGYAKPGDAVTITFSKPLKAIAGIQINTYSSDPSDGVTISVGYAQLPDGTNHVATINIDGKSKRMTIVETNANFQKRS